MDLCRQWSGNWDKSDVKVEEDEQRSGVSRRRRLS